MCRVMKQNLFYKCFPFFCSLHQHGTNHGLGSQSDRDSIGRDWPLGRCVHAQESTEVEVSLREERQGDSFLFHNPTNTSLSLAFNSCFIVVGFLLVNPQWLERPDLLHDSQQARPHQLVIAGTL